MEEIVIKQENLKQVSVTKMQKLSAEIMGNALKTIQAVCKSNTEQALATVCLSELIQSCLKEVLGEDNTKTIQAYLKEIENGNKSN